MYKLYSSTFSVNIFCFVASSGGVHVNKSSIDKKPSAKFLSRNTHTYTQVPA